MRHLEEFANFKSSMFNVHLEGQRPRINTFIPQIIEGNKLIQRMIWIHTKNFFCVQ